MTRRTWKWSSLLRGWLSRRTPWWPVAPQDIAKVNSTEQVVAAVLAARRDQGILRVCGSQHSMNRVVFDPLTRGRVVRLKLEGDLRKVERLEPGVYRVGGGCNFGVDGLDPCSNTANSFSRIADADGYALPLLGGMSAQTVGGFMATGSSGGSTHHGIADCLESFEIVDGLGQVRVLVRGSADFEAAGVSMGLFGIVTHATFRLQPHFLVEGTEQTVPYARSMLRDGVAFQQECRLNEYLHVLWVPNRGVENVLQFVGNQRTTHGAIQAYVHPLRSELMNVAAHLVVALANRALMKGQHRLVRQLLLLLNPNDKQPRRFKDHWWRALPNDDLAAINTWVRVQFTEIWIDIAEADDVVTTLRELFADDAIACGSFGVELYAAKRSPFWMSMAHGRDVIRVDPYWLEYNRHGTLPDFFERFWLPLLSRFPSARLHWGKHVPEFGRRYGEGEGQVPRVMGPDYCRKSFVHFDAWLAKRAEFDPDEIFMTDYWRSMMLGPQTSEPVAQEFLEAPSSKRSPAWATPRSVVS